MDLFVLSIFGSKDFSIMLKTEPPSNWIPSNTSLLKTFQFNSTEKLTEFMLGILNVVHEPGDPILEATETITALSMEVSIEFAGHSEKSVYKIAKEVENLFIWCSNGKNGSFWK